MNIVYINYEDIIGRRFNGCNYALRWMAAGDRCDMFVADKGSEFPFVHRVWPGKLYGLIHKICRFIEKQCSLQNILLPPALFYRRAIRQADVIHANLISGSYLSFWELSLLSRVKPVILQLHEFSPMTGRCPYPVEGCLQWLDGCAECPDIGGIFPLKRDRAAFLWQYKKFVWQRSRCTMVVASNWLLSKVNQSPMFTHCPKHVIPFGLDLTLFQPGDRTKSRYEFGIRQDAFVIFFRALASPYKGLETIRQALKKLALNHPVTLITINGVGLLDDLKDRYEIQEHNWVGDEQAIVRFFHAADLFLMPSSQESFGMMAMEAMACGIPSIVTQGTPLEEVACVPEGGIAIPVNDAEALCAAIADLAEDDAKRSRMGRKARELAVQRYDFNRTAAALYQLYREVASRNTA